MVQIIRDDKHTIECWPEHLYIPHGSDNTVYLHQPAKITFTPLYPTWFR